MIYLSDFHFVSDSAESQYVAGNPKTLCTYYESFYPFGFFPARGLRSLEMSDITILYGGNGSGKTTALNVMADALHLTRSAQYNRTDFFEDYIQMCQFHTLHAIPRSSLILTSDDVFDYMLTVRAINDDIDDRRSDLIRDVRQARRTPFRMQSLEEYDRLKLTSEARRMTNSQIVRRKLANNVRTRSNGESAFQMFGEKIRSDALYLLDEPENSLSATHQLDLAQFLGDSARFFNCQFIIATHSPFLLAIPGARVYDLDSFPVRTRLWTELENVRAFYDFFKAHEEEF
ncbi:MAG: AAA family ATPase [Gemmiger sp.]|uniref:ATP-binding cassette domain-containing protein n=1 Tax=Gemmiger sp. TaxID=2049027 RepID=UPI002E790C8D|nr:ATP-binding cassette domain-containing protein [Gemmiger sp.]MEE0801188.1 AAA family ATPase [Gemmiger sp.]